MGFGLLLAVAPVLAHHSFAAEYDPNGSIALKGMVTKLEWTNPHIYCYIDVKEENGNVVNWVVEGYPPNTLKRTGFSRDLLKVGDKIGMTGAKAKDGANRAAGRDPSG